MARRFGFIFLLFGFLACSGNPGPGTNDTGTNPDGVALDGGGDSVGSDLFASDIINADATPDVVAVPVAPAVELEVISIDNWLMGTVWNPSQDPVSQAIDHKLFSYPGAGTDQRDQLGPGHSQ